MGGLGPRAARLPDLPPHRGAPPPCAPRAPATTVHFDRGERIWTESSYKYDEHQIDTMGAAAGFAIAEQWSEADARFALTLFKAR